MSMSSPSSSSVSWGWEEVIISQEDDESSISKDSVESEQDKEVNPIGNSYIYVNEEEENTALPNISEKTNKREVMSQYSTSKAHELSESEDSSAELDALSFRNKNPAGSSMNMNESARTDRPTTSSRNVVNDRLSSSEIGEADYNSEEINGSNSKVSLDNREKKIARLNCQNNKVLTNEDFVALKLEGELSVENIADEEIWMVQCPLDLDPKKLVNKEFDFAGTSEFAIETENTEKVYAATACAGRWKSLSCLLPSTKRNQIEAVVVNAAGQIIITEKVMNSQLNSALPARSNKMEFPETLKVRHPLFGAEYEKELDIRRKRLLVSSLEKKRKKKKKRKEVPNDISHGTISEDQADDCIPSLSEDMETQKDIAVKSKKAKKRRHSESYNTNPDHSDKDDTAKLEGRHLKKRFRKSPPSNSIVENMETDCHIHQEHSKKKKKKKKHDV